VREAACPICNADVPMDGDESQGDTVYCAYCKAPLRIAKLGPDEDPELEEEF
jgi:hypothetical protein